MNEKKTRRAHFRMAAPAIQCARRFFFFFFYSYLKETKKINNQFLIDAHPFKMKNMQLSALENKENII